MLVAAALLWLLQEDAEDLQARCAKMRKIAAELTCSRHGTDLDASDDCPDCEEGKAGCEAEPDHTCEERPPCDVCGGSRQVRCTLCSGKGGFASKRGSETVRTPCPDCGGDGWAECKLCRPWGKCATCLRPETVRCGTCRDTKKCVVCRGTGKLKQGRRVVVCVECSGKAWCVPCSGHDHKRCDRSGKLECKRCGGRGKIDPCTSCAGLLIMRGHMEAHADMLERKAKSARRARPE